jgi:S-formylglutathione hydrolase FrmB
MDRQALPAIDGGYGALTVALRHPPLPVSSAFAPIVAPASPAGRKGTEHLGSIARLASP